MNSALPLPRRSLSFLPGLREADGNGLLATLDLASTTAFAALGRALFVAMHLPFDFLLRAPRICPLTLSLRHRCLHPLRYPRSTGSGPIPPRLSMKANDGWFRDCDRGAAMASVARVTQKEAPTASVGAS